MQAFDTYVKDTTAKLGRKITELEDVHAIMPVLKEVTSSSAGLLLYAAICNLLIALQAKCEFDHTHIIIMP